MRFSKAPLIATLMAVALSLLVILPALAENSIRTDGQQGLGALAADRVVVGVFSDPLDAQYDWQAFTEVKDDKNVVTGADLVYNREARTVAKDGSSLDPMFAANATAYLIDDIVSDPKSAKAHPADPRNTFFGGTLYVSNDPNAYNTVLINAQELLMKATAVHGAKGTKTAVYCVMANVRNERSGGAGIDVPLVNAAGDVKDAEDKIVAAYKKFQNFFEVVSDVDSTVATTSSCADFAAFDTATPPASTGPTTAADLKKPQQIAARSGDRLTIRVEGGTREISLTVDGDGPEISGETPADGTIQNSARLGFSFSVNDELSGLRHDAEEVLSEGPDYPDGDSDPVVSNLDKDNFESNEPISDRDGRSTDINVWYGTSAATVKENTFKTPGDDISIGGTDKWTAQVVGRKYDFRSTYVDDGDGAYPVYWLVEARDRAGNITRTDADSSEMGDDPYSITIDLQDPTLKGETASTGIKYDSSKDKEVTDRSYLAFDFAGSQTVGIALDPDSIDIDDFYVEGFAIVDYIHPTEKPGMSVKNFDDDAFDPRASVYVELDRPLGSGETPEVQLRHGAVRDLAGNVFAGTAPKKAIDRIGPLLTVTVNGAAQDRPVIKADDGKLDITVSADEALRGTPEIWFAKIKYVAEVKDDPDTTDTNEAKAAHYAIDTQMKGATLARAAGDETSWLKTYDSDIIGDTKGHYAVIVTAEDAASGANNPGYTAGWGSGDDPAEEKKLDIDDLDDAGLIYEVDNDLPKAKVSVSPTRVDDTTGTETESRYPFLHIEFNGLGANEDEGEDKEYGITGLKDSHSRVVLRSLRVNGTDMLALVQGQVLGDKGQFSLALPEQELGDYEVEYEAVDDAGNEVDDDFTFSVVPRAPYKVKMVPGWNLVSLPGTPLDQSIGSVMAATSAKAVLGYRNGNWESAIRAKAEDGTFSPWQGSLTSIEGGYGYWIQTDQFESIETLIPEVDPASTLPTVPVSGGWNLLGVIDVRQAKAGASPLGKGGPDEYFTSVSWRVAYGFDTIMNAWEKLIPKEAGNKVVKNGKGYWVWSSKPGTLVP